MEDKELKNGIISEEALDEVAGGLSINKETLKKGLKKAGIAVAGTAVVVGTIYEGKKLYGHIKGSGQSSNVEEKELVWGEVTPSPEEKIERF